MIPGEAPATLLPTPPPSAGKNIVTAITFEVATESALPIHEEAGAILTKSAETGTTLEPEPTAGRPVKEKQDDGLPSSQPPEPEKTQGLETEKVEGGTDLKSEIQQLKERLNQLEESYIVRTGPPPEPHRRVSWRRRRRRSRSPISFTSDSSDSSDSFRPSRPLGPRAARPIVVVERPHAPPPSSTPPICPKPRVEASLTSLNYVTWEAFKDLDEAGSPFVIDVLVGEPEPKLQVTVPGMPNPLAHGSSDRKSGGDITTVNTTADGTHSPLPERIRINSPTIIKFLEWVTGKGANGGTKLSKDSVTSILMMQPFRALVYRRDKIRTCLAKLQAENTDAIPSEKTSAGGEQVLETETKDGPASGSEDTEVNEIRRILSHEKALDHINCLVEFLKNEIESRIAYVESSEIQKIVFSDIWLLFKPGELVLDKDGKQAYRVYKVEYANHGMTQPSPRELWMHGPKARLIDVPIRVFCVHVDFDGERLGPVHKIILLNRFEGEKSVRSLDVIPLRLIKGHEEMKKSLIARGSTFIDACHTGRRGIPMHYSGHTLDTKEEVDSQVVIDFEEAFSADDEQRGKGKGTGMKSDLGLIVAGIAGAFMASSDAERGRRKDGMRELVASTVLRAARASKWKPFIRDVEDDAVPEDDYHEDDGSDLGSPSRPKLRRRLRRTPRPLPSRRKFMCIPECCASETVFDDCYVEGRWSNDFIHDQFLEKDIGSLAIMSRPLKDLLDKPHLITDKERIIVSYRAFGFIMRSRKWAQLDLTYLGPAKGENTFDLLVLPPGHRDMVESLVTQHYVDKAAVSDETDETDIVRGKGKGLILLLHGAPGVGKTSTAECVANYFQKPLFQITCGDLGSTANVVEERLEHNFALASRWGCILLIDEADVFLEARQTENFDRNSLVAVFLRTLEYYTGILFLTTNRVGTFDEAFTSRIHISLYYPPLDLESTLAVFKVNQDRIKKRFELKKKRGIASLQLDEFSIQRFVIRYYNKYEDSRWNGRQIRNACQTALALAEFEAQKATNPGVAGARKVKDVVDAASKSTSETMVEIKMTATHFLAVAKAFLAFVRYLREVHGMTAAQQASRLRLRQDRYDLNGDPTAAAAGGYGLLAARQRQGAGGAGGGRQQRPMQKQGFGRPAALQPRRAATGGLNMEDDLGLDGLALAGQSEDDLLRDEEDGEALSDDEDGDGDEADAYEGLEDEEEGDYPEYGEGDGGEFGDEEAPFRDYEDEDRGQDAGNEYLYEAPRPKVQRAPRPTGGGSGGRAPVPRSWGQQQQLHSQYETAGPTARAQAAVAAAAPRGTGKGVAGGRVPRGEQHQQQQQQQAARSRAAGGAAGRGRNPRVLRHD